MQAKDQIRILPYRTSRKWISLLAIMCLVAIMIFLAYTLVGLRWTRRLVVYGFDK